MSAESLRRTLVLRWALVLAWMAAIFAVSSIPASSLPAGPSGFAHLFEYSVLGGLVAGALRPSTSLRRAVGYAVLISSVYGMTDEIHQSFTPGRRPDVADWGLDTIAALIGAGITVAAIRRRERKA